MSQSVDDIHSHYNAIWLSDIHLGYKGCRAEFLLDFLQNCHSATLYLVGDIIDFRAMSNRFLWPASHHAVFCRILELAARGTRVVYIPGNHDVHARDISGQQLLNVEVITSGVHITAEGKKLLMMHGDEFEYVVRCSKLNRLVGNIGYDFLLFLNRWSNRLRRLCRLPYWSLAYYVKNRVKNARQAIEAFETAAAAEARCRRLDGIVCGHIHQPEIRSIDGILYCNDGDWVESCTALVEQRNGRLQLIHWGDLQQSIKTHGATNDEPVFRPLRLPALNHS